MIGNPLVFGAAVLLSLILGVIFSPGISRLFALLLSDVKKEYAKALKFLLKASTFNNEENVALSLAIDCVATSTDEKLRASGPPSG